MKRAITAKQLIMKKFKEMDFTGMWEESFGKPEFSGIWLVWGNSGNGKTRLVLQLAKYLSNFGLVAYNTLEEGARKSMQRAVIDTGMDNVKNFVILDREMLPELIERLSRKKSPDIVLVDSIQYLNITKDEYIKLKILFPDKLFIFISHAEGNHPEGRLAKFIKYDADVKIHVCNYEANIVSRYGGGKPFVIWEKERRKILGN